MGRSPISLSNSWPLRQRSRAIPKTRTWPTRGNNSQGWRIIMKQFRIIAICLAGLLVVYLGPGMIFKWSAERVFVGPDEALMVINKFGDPLPSDKIVVPADANHYKGIQEELRGP